MTDIFNELHLFACYDDLIELHESKYVQDWTEDDELVEVANEH